MAVQKSKVTRARRGSRRSHDALAAPALSIDSTAIWHGKARASSGRLPATIFPVGPSSSMANGAFEPPSNSSAMPQASRGWRENTNRAATCCVPAVRRS